MKMSFASLLAISCSALAIGCSSKPATTPAAPSKSGSQASSASTEHTHGSGPNGGVVFDFGSHHAEFTVDHGKKECMIVVLGDDEKTPSPVSATELVLVTKETQTAEGTAVSPMTITMKPADAADGKASKFVGSDPGIGNVADFAGTVTGEVDAKPAQGEFQE